MWCRVTPHMSMVTLSYGWEARIVVLTARDMAPVKTYYGLYDRGF